MLDASQIYDKFKVLERRNRTRDQRWQDVRAARRGELDMIFPDMTSDDFPKPIIANFIDVAARDLAEMISPLPSFNCSSSAMNSDAGKKRADTRTKIATWFMDNSKVDVQMLWGADHYLTYGLATFYLEPDFEVKAPRILVEDPMGGYPEYDRWRRVISYTKRFYHEADVLAHMYPEYADHIFEAAKDNAVYGDNLVEMVRYCDAHQLALVLSAKHPVCLEDAPNRLGETPIVVTHRPWLDNREPKGQFDDVIWVQLARDLLAKMTLEATEKQVQAPIAVPPDVQDFPIGPDALLRTQTPEKVRRVGLELTRDAFVEQQMLLQEMQQGTRYPAARTGGIDASIVTGKGVEALLGGFDSQIKAAQLSFKDAFTEVLRLAFKMDERLWPSTQKEIRGQSNGSPYELSYKPSRDIAGDHTVDVSYGFAATGLDPNRATVLMLQLRAEKLFSRDYFARQLPFGFDVGLEQTKVQTEEMREAILQSIFAFVQSIPAMAQMGMDPADAVLKASAIVKGIQKGDPIEDVVAKVFVPPPPAPAVEGEPGAGLEAGPGGPGGGAAGVGGGLTPSGLMRGVAPGQAGAAPGGRPDLSVMLAGLTGGGQPSMSAFTMRRRRT